MSSALTGGSVPIRLNGTVYQVAPLNDKDVSELDSYVRFIHMETAKEAARGADQGMQQMILSAAIGQASSLSFMSPQGAAIIKSIDGVARILWHGIKHNHPEVTHDFVRQQMFVSKENLAEANRVFEELNVKPLEALASRGKARAAALSRKKSSTTTSVKNSRSRRKK